MDVDLSPKALRRIAVASSIGSALECYDFLVYGTASALVFGKVFFPTGSSFASTLASFATFAVGFAGRPIGGLIFGHLGDRIGRKQILWITLLMIGLASVGIGLTPSYATIGVWAPILLVFFRIIQGVAFGGDISGGQLIMVEQAPDRERGFYGALVAAASPIGSAISGTVLLVFSATLSTSQFESWGWRIPFLLSIVMVLAGVWVRIGISESAAFQAIKKKGAVESAPLWAAIKRHPVRVLLSLLTFATGIAYYMNTVYVISYAHDRGVSSTTMLWLVVIMCALILPAFPVIGKLADRYGRKPVMSVGVAWTIISMIFYFRLVDSGRPVEILAAMMLVAIGFYLFYGVQLTYVAEQFDIRVRYSSLALANSVGNVIFGGLTPYVATALLNASNGKPWSIEVYAVLGQLIGLGAMLGLHELGPVSIGEDSPLNDDVSSMERTISVPAEPAGAQM